MKYACIQKNVVCVLRDANIYEAANLMKRHHVGDLVVIQPGVEGKNIPVGILTDRDIIVEVIANHVPIEEIKVEDIMSRTLITAPENQQMYEYIHLMKQNGIRRLPIVDKRGYLVGIVTADDILESVGQELAGLAKISKIQRKMEEYTFAAAR